METGLNTRCAHPVSPPPSAQVNRGFHFLYKRSEGYLSHIMVYIDGSYFFFFLFSYIFFSLVCVGTLEEALVIHRILQATVT